MSAIETSDNVEVEMSPQTPQEQVSEVTNLATEENKTEVEETTDPATRRKQIQLLAETYIAEHGNKAVVKAIARGHIDTEILQAIARYAEQEGVKLRLRDTIGKTIHVTPMLRSLQTISSDLRYSNDLLFYTAVQKELYSTVEYLLMQGADPLCRNGMCILDAMSNRSLLHLLLDYVPNAGVGESTLPVQIIEHATQRNDNNLVRLLLIKGSGLSDQVLDAWCKTEAKEWVLLRLYVRYQPAFVLNYKRGKIIKDLIKGTVDGETKREMFSFLVSKLGKSLLSYVNLNDTDDEFVRFMMRDLEGGLYDGLNGGEESKETKKRKTMEVQGEIDGQ